MYWDAKTLQQESLNFQPSLFFLNLDGHMIMFPPIFMIFEAATQLHNIISVAKSKNQRFGKLLSRTEFV